MATNILEVGQRELVPIKFYRHRITQLFLVVELCTTICLAVLIKFYTQALSCYSQWYAKHTMKSVFIFNSHLSSMRI